MLHSQYRMIAGSTGKEYPTVELRVMVPVTKVFPTGSGRKSIRKVQLVFGTRASQNLRKEKDEDAKSDARQITYSLR